MKRWSVLHLWMLACLTLPLAANAGDFDWLDSLNIEATADTSGYQVTLASRFHIGDAEVNAVISNTDKPADAYMVLRLGELADRPVEEVLQVYESDRNKGWGVMAKNLGIKPGSSEFHALKRGHDLGDIGGGHGHSTGKGKRNVGNRHKG